jgi:hypothetical protein
MQNQDLIDILSEKNRNADVCIMIGGSKYPIKDVTIKIRDDRAPLISISNIKNSKKKGD